MKTEKYQTFNPDWNKNEIKEKTKPMLKEIGALQYKMYAERKHSLLIVLQGLDASGKDGLTRGLLQYCNPVGIKTKSFKKPTPDEFAHDFLWRVHQAVPAKGEIQIFIRSHYEDILVPSVEGYYTEEMIDQRYGLINDFEKLLEHNDTHILKFFLNVSLETQEERLRERIELKEKHWKHSDGDWETRKKFDKYQEVYKRILRECNVIPWHVVPADKNWQKLYDVAKEVLKALKSMDSRWPELESTLFEAT
jgi:PPK2 family polyphosphate:nucleotide phosphotransferase